jgi:hypothetical protein
LMARKAREIKKAINKVEGARHYYWKTEGLPQMTVRYDRSKIARVWILRSWMIWLLLDLLENSG